MYRLIIYPETSDAGIHSHKKKKQIVCSPTSIIQSVQPQISAESAEIRDSPKTEADAEDSQDNSPDDKKKGKASKLKAKKTDSNKKKERKKESSKDAEKADKSSKGKSKSTKLPKEVSKRYIAIHYCSFLLPFAKVQTERKKTKRKGYQGGESDQH